MRIESVEQSELGNIMELSITGQEIRWARQGNPIISGGVSLRKSGWTEHEESKSSDSREKIHPIVLVVTIRACEEKGICSAATRELLRFVKDQVGE